MTGHGAVTQPVSGARVCVVTDNSSVPTSDADIYVSEDDRACIYWAPTGCQSLGFLTLSQGSVAQMRKQAQKELNDSSKAMGNSPGI